MANFNSLEEAREFFYKDKFAVDTGITLDELTEDKAICSLVLNDDHKNAYGGVMGGVIFTLADFAFAVACNAQLKEPVSFTLDSRISFLQAARSSVLFAEAKVVRSGGKISFYTIEVTDDTGTLVAAVYSTGYRPG